MLVIGLTGGIGSGKTTVSGFLEELGAEVIDADKVGHVTYLPDMPAWRDLIDTWGEDLLQPNREVDRKKLGAIVFSDPANLEKLNSIVHPRMRDIMNDRIEGFRGEGKQVVVVDAAILIEAKWTSLVDEVWVTAAPEDIVVQRVMARNGWGRGAGALAHGVADADGGAPGLRSGSDRHERLVGRSPRAGAGGLRSARRRLGGLAGTPAASGTPP